MEERTMEEAASAEAAKRYQVRGDVRAGALALLDSLVSDAEGRVVLRGVQVSMVGLLRLALMNSPELPAPSAEE
jgi:hypothetical protein